ncbi:hypothetical protein GHT06_019103 [Daphnia sinensis]|uniref:Ubiquitin-like protease family profile domain-containing protein n=1 Tax=Daphnia sinensis TaxID=1820382 RepID=A0AAD5KJL7_9CRUS|nr:hypothetical protein GHT06_019103 [Daphnia sinensis]
MKIMRPKYDFFLNENDVIVEAVVTSPTGLHPTKHKDNPTTEKDQFNEAMIFFRKLAETMSVLSSPDFNHKMHLFREIHSLIKKDKPVQIMQNAIPSAVSIIPSPTFGGDSVSHEDDPSTYSAVQVQSDLPHPWAAHLSTAPKARGRPRKNAGYFSSYYKQQKRLRVEQEEMGIGDNKLLEEEAELLGTEEKLINSDVDNEESLLPDTLPTPTSPGPVFVPHEATSQQWVQIVHDGSGNWVLVAKGFTQENHVLVYHSTAGSNWRSKHILSCMSSLLKTPEKKMTYVVKACQRQGNGFDCSVFAIAFATSLANGQDPALLLYHPHVLSKKDLQRSGCFRIGVLPLPENRLDVTIEEMENDRV